MNCHAGVTIALWADREAGQYLKDMQDSNGRQKQGGDRKSNSQNESLIYTPTLEDLDIDYNESSRWHSTREGGGIDFPYVGKSQCLSAARARRDRKIKRRL